ncbi:MAG: glycosyltransferase family 2 protein [Endomicrobia bacterium]|nr:glycosyltransferase family 2 protein [Endomicrobiia bacterium]
MDFLVRILIVANGIVIFFFLQFVVYGVISYFYYLNQKKKLKLTVENLVQYAKNQSKELPFVTVVIPAKDEVDIISATIDRFVSLCYPKQKLCILFILDEKELLVKPYNETTHSIVEQKAKYYNKKFGVEIIKYTSVPVGFDGNYNGIILSTPVNSTKPRALNWAVKFLPKDTEIIGFYDADSQPDPDTLLYVAYKYLTKKHDEKLLLQGPVVQVRNYFHLRPFNKIFALAQAITHEWYLPTLMAHLPFIGGTNFFVEPDLLHRVKGFNNKVLSEDLDLGCRLFVETNTWPQFMPYITTEQTPPNYKSYFYQRVRWASGYVQVLKTMFTSEKFLKKRFLLSCMLVFYGILPWFAAQIVAVTGLGIFFISLFGLSHLFVFIPQTIKLLLLSITLSYVVFLFYYFNHAVKKVYVKIDNNNGVLKEYLNFLLVPIAATLGAVPYTYGFLTSFFTSQKVEWKKTIRTKE